MRTAPCELAGAEATTSALGNGLEMVWMQFFTGNKTNFKKINPDVDSLVHLTLAAHSIFRWNLSGEIVAVSTG